MSKIAAKYFHFLVNLQFTAQISMDSWLAGCRRENMEKRRHQALMLYPTLKASRIRFLCYLCSNAVQCCINIVGNIVNLNNVIAFMKADS